MMIIVVIIIYNTNTDNNDNDNNNDNNHIDGWWWCINKCRVRSGLHRPRHRPHSPASKWGQDKRVFCRRAINSHNFAIQ